MNKTESTLQNLICSYNCTVEIIFMGTHYAVYGKQEKRSAVGTGATIEEAAKDCYKAFQMVEETDRRIAACVCCRTSRDGKFTCNKAIKPQPGADATNSLHWCSICVDCQKEETAGYARAESAEAARIEQDYH